MPTEKEKLTEIAYDEDESLSPILALPAKMQRFIHLYITGQYTLAKLAQLLEVHPNTLSNWLKRKDVQEIIAEMQITTHEVVNNQLKALTLKAANRLAELMDSTIDGVALQAVKDVLDRAGHKTKQEIKIDKTVTTVEQKLQNLISETIVDADFEVIESDEES